MSTLDTGLTLIRNASRRVSAANGWMGNAFKSWMPTGLYARALLIMIVPMVILQIGGRVRVHGAALEHGDAAAVGRRGAGHRRLIDVYKCYPQDKERAQLRRIGAAAAARGRFPPRRRHAAAGAKTVLLAARPDALGSARPPDRPAVLDRHRRQIQSGRDPHPARRRRDARVRAAQRRLRLQFGDLHLLDAGHVARSC